MTLAQVPIGYTATIQKVNFEHPFDRRCLALGLRPDAQVTVVRQSILNGPLQIRVGTTDLALRQELAQLIEVL